MRKVPDPKFFKIQQIETLPVTAAQLKTATNRDSALSRVLKYTKKGWPSEVLNRIIDIVDQNCLLKIIVYYGAQESLYQ